MFDPTTEALVIVLAAVVVSIGGGVVQCQQKNDCVALKTCANTSTNAWMGVSCSFTNYVDLAGDRAYNGVNPDTFVSLVRGVCAPGERMIVSDGMATSTCAPHYPYPNALSTEIMDPDGVHQHDKSCGKWIDAKPTLSVTSVQSFSFYDNANFENAIHTAEKALYTGSRMSFTDMGKFYATCERTATTGAAAVRASAVQAYAHLVDGINTTDYAAAIGSLGWISSHSCDSPVQLGFGVSASRKFELIAKRGTNFEAGTLRQALYIMEQPTSMQDAAEAGNKYVQDYAFNSAVVTLSDYERLYEGATHRTDHANVALRYEITPEFDSFALLASKNLGQANAYLHGVAARCAVNLWGALDTRPGNVIDADAYRAKTRAMGLGRLATPEPGIAAVSNETVLSASVVTFGQLRAEPVGNPSEDCAELARFLFPDRLDRLRFGLLVPDHLYAKLETLTADMKQHVADALNLDPNLQGLVQDTSKVVGHIRDTLVRIPGAPRGSWAAIQRNFADGQLTDASTPLKMALQQAKALFQDRLNLAFDFKHHCAGPPVYDALASNGVISHDFSTRHLHTLPSRLTCSACVCLWQGTCIQARTAHTFCWACSNDRGPTCGTTTRRCIPGSAT
tara:strand:+ start:4152 stop:6014 length:1863 start_codon:yes stop_codon:yes gene_type:complete